MIERLDRGPAHAQEDSERLGVPLGAMRRARE